MPPRTANWPRSSTRSTRSYPASASASARPSTPGSSPTRSATGAGPCGERRHPLGERERRRADEPARGEHVERPVALADEVRRRREPGVEPHAPAGRSATRAPTREPAGRLGRVARVGVLGEEDEKPAPELLVERGEEQRQHAAPRRARGPAARGRTPGSARAGAARRRRRRAGRRGLGPAGQVCEQRVVHAIGRARPAAAIVLRAGQPAIGRRRAVPACPTCPQGHPRCPSETVARDP